MYTFMHSMSSHGNNTRRLPNGNHAYAYAYLHPFHPTHLNERVGVGVAPWWSSLQDTIFTLPSSSTISFQPPRMRLVVFRDNLANNRNLRSRPTRQGNSNLTPDDQRIAFEKLKKEVYNPILKKTIQRLGRFYRQNDASRGQKTEKQAEEEDDDDDKKCVICLENFKAKEVVTVTPCNHMFHGDCILPWVKAHGRCPVCRLSFVERTGENGALPTNNDNLVDDALTNDLISFPASGGHFTATRPFWF